MKQNCIEKVRCIGVFMIYITCHPAYKPKQIYEIRMHNIDDFSAETFMQNPPRSVNI